MSLFADDTALASIKKSWSAVELDLNESLLKLQNWSEKWFLNFNVTKTFYMMISNKHSDNERLNLSLLNLPISKVSEHKHLGVIFNDKLTWSDHVIYTCNRVSKKLGLLYQNRKFFNRATLIKFYFSMIRPMIEYGSILYDNLTIADENKIENLQRRAALICIGALPRSETSLLYKDLGWDSLKSRRLNSKLCLLYKINNGMTQNYLLEDIKKFTKIINPNSRVTRSASKSSGFDNPFGRTDKFKNSFFPSTLKLWNNMSTDIRTLDSLNKFKKYLNKKFEVEQCFFDYNLFNMGGSKILAQLRLGLSNLRSHLFKYNLTDNPFCQGCLNEIETLAHFLFVCPCYENVRLKYTSCIRLFVPDVDNISKLALSQICVAGMPRLDFTCNYNILRITTEYILESKRFVAEL